MRSVLSWRSSKAGTAWQIATVFIGSGGAFLKNTFSSTVQADITDINASLPRAADLDREADVAWVHFLANYTYSKSLTTFRSAKAFPVSTRVLNAAVHDPNRHKMDYGRRAFDHTHVFTGSYVCTLPESRVPARFLFAICWMTTKSADRFAATAAQSLSCRNRTLEHRHRPDRGPSFRVSIPIALTPAPASLQVRQLAHSPRPL